ncbi:MAG: hypothetical protein WB565_10285 [Acidimicrobiales bacterium]
MDRHRLYRVIIDGKTEGELWPGQTAFFGISPGAHRVRVKIDFMGSNELSVEPRAGQVLDLVCKGNGSAVALFKTIFARNSYVNLRLMTSDESEKARITHEREAPRPRNLGTSSSPSSE